MSIAQKNDPIITFIDFLSIFAQFCSHYNMFIHSITYRKGKTMNLKTLISTTALAISANTFAVDLASKNTDSYQHIRNATGRLNYAGKTFLIDPMLAEKGRYAGF